MGERVDLAVTAGCSAQAKLAVYDGDSCLCRVLAVVEYFHTQQVSCQSLSTVTRAYGRVTYNGPCFIAPLGSCPLSPSSCFSCSALPACRACMSHLPLVVPFLLFPLSFSILDCLLSVHVTPATCCSLPPLLLVLLPPSCKACTPHLSLVLSLLPSLFFFHFPAQHAQHACYTCLCCSELGPS